MLKRLFLVVLLVSGIALADDIGVNFTNWTLSNSPSVWSLGFAFTANDNATVTALGAFDFGQDGLVQPQQIGLWDANQNLLASVFVTNSDPLDGLWRFHAITPIVLIPGDTYYVASQGGEGYVWLPTDLAVASEINFVRDAWHFVGDTSNNPLFFPEQTDNLAGFFGGNLTLSSVPEPGTLLLLGPALLGLAGFARRNFN